MSSCRFQLWQHLDELKFESNIDTKQCSVQWQLQPRNHSHMFWNSRVIFLLDVLQLQVLHHCSWIFFFLFSYILLFLHVLRACVLSCCACTCVVAVIFYLERRLNHSNPSHIGSLILSHSRAHPRGHSHDVREKAAATIHRKRKIIKANPHTW